MEIKNYLKIRSTNLKAKEIGKLGAKKWTVVVSKSQINGYGKDKVFWFSPKGGLYFSIILPKSNIEDLQTLTILAAFVVAKVIKNNFFIEPLIKLPNDILIGKKKIVGILVENIVGKDVKLSVMGIGINTNIKKFPGELKKSATSLEIELKKKVNNEKLLKKIVNEMKEQLKTISK